MPSSVWSARLEKWFGLMHLPRPEAPRPRPFVQISLKPCLNALLGGPRAVLCRTEFRAAAKVVDREDSDEHNPANIRTTLGPR